VTPFKLLWLQLDTDNPATLARVRSEAHCPIASCETLHGRRWLLPFLQADAVDVAIIDVTSLTGSTAVADRGD
jgi:L-alanine-DL-glutamate epimerase-like enolase superfamily enzyme